MTTGPASRPHNDYFHHHEQDMGKFLDVFNEFATDPDLEVKGTWRQLGSARVLIARSGDQDHTNRLSELARARQSELDAGGDVAEEVYKEIVITALSETVLLGWEGLGYKGEELVYSAENAKMLLGHRDFRDRIIKLSEEVTSYRMKLEDSQKNG